jgi:hypothetical protein
MKTEIRFRLKINKGFRGAGTWEYFEIEDLITGPHLDSRAYDLTTKSLHAGACDQEGSPIYDGDILEFSARIGFGLDPNPAVNDNQGEHELRIYFRGVVRNTPKGHVCSLVNTNARDMPVEAFTEAVIKGSIFDDHESGKCPLCEGVEYVYVCESTCDKCYAANMHCPGVSSKPCPACNKPKEDQ